MQSVDQNNQWKLQEIAPNLKVGIVLKAGLASIAAIELPEAWVEKEAQSPLGFMLLPWNLTDTESQIWHR